MKKRKSDKQIIKILALSKKPLTPYRIKEETKLSFSTVHEVIKGKKGLEKRGIVRVATEQKWRSGLVSKTYRLSFLGLMNFFAFSEKEKDIEKAIKNYKELHVFFQHWDKLPKFEVKIIGSAIFGSKDFLNIYDVLKLSAMECLGYIKWGAFPHVPFESALLPPPHNRDEIIKDQFTMSFLQNLRRLNVEIKPDPEIYEYVKSFFKNRERDFEKMKEFIEKFK